LHIWKNSIVAESSEVSVLAGAAPFMLSDHCEDASTGDKDTVCRQRSGIAAFLARELLTSARLVPAEEAGNHGCLDELVRSTTDMFSRNMIDHWQPIGLEYLVDAIDVIGSDIKRPWLEHKQDLERALRVLDQHVTNDTGIIEQASIIY
jgi:hypothetical protein